MGADSKISMEGSVLNSVAVSSTLKKGRPVLIFPSAKAVMVASVGVVMMVTTNGLAALFVKISRLNETSFCPAFTVSPCLTKV